MALTEPESRQDQISPDGQYRWNGEEWVANTDSSTAQETTPSADVEPTKKNWIGRHKVLAGVGAAVVGLIVIGGAIGSGGSGSLSAESQASLQAAWDGQDYTQHIVSCYVHIDNPNLKAASNLATEAGVGESDSAKYLDGMCSVEGMNAWQPAEEAAWEQDLYR